MPDRPPPHPADHAEDFSRRYAEGLDIAAGQIMMDLGLTSNQMGARDAERGGEHHSFFPGERTAGGLSPAGQVTLDSGIMNPAVMDEPYGAECGQLWRKSRLRDRMQAIVAHEVAEHEQGDHELALIAAPETKLPISHKAREIARAMEAGWKGYCR